MGTKSKQAPSRNLRDRIAQLERNVPKVRNGKGLPKLSSMARNDLYAFAVALEAGYWLNLLKRFECALILIGETVTATQGKVIGSFCREVMASEQPMSKPWTRA